MNQFRIIKDISVKTDSKILLFVLDGLGDIPYGGKMVLEVARKKNLDRLAYEGICGLADVVDYGITPGSGPGHLAIFGYEPTEYEIGRGVLSALGIDFDLEITDVAARGNFATKDLDGKIIDRRAGRLSTEKCTELCNKLQSNITEIDGVKVIIKPEKDYRFVLILRGSDLDASITDTDPLILGMQPLEPIAMNEKAIKTVEVINKIIKVANDILREEKVANTILLRGFASKPDIPTFSEVYKLTPLAIATYPMYRGLAKLVGMQVAKVGDKLEEEFECLRSNYNKYDYFYFHVKKTDSYGEDGNFEAKVKEIEKFDELFGNVFDLNPDVIVVTGDHSTPVALKAHSWHPVPFILWSKNERQDKLSSFTEAECVKGSLGRFPMKKAMNLMMAAALKFKKWGA